MYCRVALDQNGPCAAFERGWGVRLDWIFWPTVITALVVLALFLAGMPGEHALEPLDQAQHLVYLVVFAAGITVASAVRLLIRGGAEAARHSVLWLAFVVVAIFAYNSRIEIRALYDSMRGEIYPSVALSTTQGEAQFRRNWDGHYRVDARINGRSQNMLIDTGASMVLLPYEDVSRLGIDPEKLAFTTPVTTANGKSTVAPIVLESIRIGSIEVRNVPAAVAHPGRLKMGLLGMSFLDQMKETSFRGDRLYLRQ